MKIKVVYFFLLALTACGPGNSGENVDKENGLVKTYREDGSVYTEANYLKGKLNGVCKTFHPDGKLFREETYVNNVLQGKATQYYSSGILYSETVYDSGKIEGIVKRFHKDGKLKAEVPYKKGCECLGLKEYILNGEERPHYPEIVIKTEDKLKSEDAYYIHLSLTERVKRVEFLVGNLNDGCLHAKLESVIAPEKSTGRIRYAVSPGSYVTDQLNVVARIETIAGNILVKQKSYSVAIKYPLH